MSDEIAGDLRGMALAAQRAVGLLAWPGAAARVMPHAHDTPDQKSAPVNRRHRGKYGMPMVDGPPIGLCRRAVPLWYFRFGAWEPSAGHWLNRRRRPASVSPRLLARGAPAQGSGERQYSGRNRSLAPSGQKAWQKRHTPNLASMEGIGVIWPGAPRHEREHPGVASVVVTSHGPGDGESKSRR